MEEQPKRDKRVGGVKKSYVTGCVVFLIIGAILLMLMFFFGYMGE